MLLAAHAIEAYAVIHHHLFQFLPAPTGDVALAQPATFNTGALHLFYECSKARDELGYKGLHGTLEGLCLQVKDWNERVEAKLARTKG